MNNPSRREGIRSVNRTLFALILFLIPSLPAVAGDPELEALARGQAALREENFDKAVAEFTEAIRLDPKDFLGYRYRGFAYASTKQWDNAIADFSELIRLDPKDSNAYANRGGA
jgi:Flp pilus assembly protein TadD